MSARLSFTPKSSKPGPFRVRSPTAPTALRGRSRADLSWNRRCSVRRARPVRTFLTWGVLLALSLGGAPGLSASTAATEPLDARDASQFAFRVEVPAPALVRQPDGTVDIEIEGFGTRERRPGAPDVPTRTLLIAIPPDAVPRLEVRSLGESRLLPFRPRPVARRYVELSDEQHEQLLRADSQPEQRFRILAQGARERFIEDPELYGAATLFPERIAWLGATGTLRDQRYVELHLAPVRFDPAAGGLQALSGLELVVHFDGATAPAGTPRDEPLFERIYEGSFVNYAQGRRFRISAGSTARARAEFSARATTTTATVGPRYRIRLATDGLVRLDYEQLSGTALAGSPISTWRVSCQGEAVALEINDDGDGVLGPGDWVQFYGEALLGEPKTVINTDFPDPFEDLFEARDFSDENAYFVTVGDGPPALVEQRDATPTLSLTPPEHFEARAVMQVDDAYQPLAGADPWYWLPTLAATGNPSARTDEIALPGLFSPALPLSVRVNVRGSSDDVNVAPDHLTRVTLRNASDEELASVDGAFDGRSLYLHELDWAGDGFGSQASDPVRVSLEVLPGNFYRNDVILDYIEVRYRHGFDVVNDQLIFEWPNEAAEFVVAGLTEPGLAGVYELRAAAGAAVQTPVLLQGAQLSGTRPFKLRFRIDEDPALPSGTARRFLVVGPSAIRTVGATEIQELAVSDLRHPEQQADLVVIAHPDVLNDAAGSPLRQLLDYRATPEGGGLSSKIVSLEELYDEFNDGLPGPTAIHEFLRWITSDAPGEGWLDPKPSLVMLLGDASYDYKAGTAKGTYVPTQILFKDSPFLGYYASDNVMAAVIGDDQLPDLVISRVTARSVEQADAVLAKILAYETTPDQSGNWRQHALLISDRGTNAGEGNLDFELTNERAVSVVCSEGESLNPNACPGSTPYSSQHLKYYSDYYTNAEVSNAREAMRADIKDAVNGVDGVANGAALLQFNGHGNFWVWSNDAFFDERLPVDHQDVRDLNNGLRLPFLMAHNCLTGGFHILDPYTMGEDWLNWPDGGAVGVFSPTGLSFNYIGQTVTDLVWTDFYGPRKERRIAVPVMHALVKLCSQGSIEPCQHYVLLGDPALQLALRDAPPPRDVVAVGGNAEATVSWTPAEGAAPGTTYDVYRTLSLEPQLVSYIRANDSPIVGGSFVDDGLINARTYYYYVVATDPEGFRSRWSNFNGDCDEDGPDCVRATPLNPAPPSVPLGLAVSDPGIGSQLQLTWIANPENDLAHYTLFYGEAPGNYGHSVDTGRATAASISGLEAGRTYYFALTATNTSGRTSALSPEVSDYPVFAPGTRPPRYIDDLRVRIAGNDLVLEWGAVSTDIYGKPTAVVLYEIFRGSGADYRNESLVKIAECASPCGQWIDSGAAALPGNVHYRVRARDGEQLVGGLGSSPPEGTVLRIERDPLQHERLVLSWDPVTEAVDGAAAELRHYVVYEAAQPFTRAAAIAGAVPVLATLAETSLDLLPPAEDRYYSVLAVDIRGNVSPY